MTEPVIRRARKGEVRCGQCIFFHPWTKTDGHCGNLHTNWWVTRRDNTCAAAEKREGEACSS